jgi:hypothetical protein
MICAHDARAKGSSGMTTISRGKLAPYRQIFLALICLIPLSAVAEPISLQALVTPSTIVRKDGAEVTFALHGFLEFHSLAELFPYIDGQSRRWTGSLDFDENQSKILRRELLRRGIESRVVSMADERPLETLITHTQAELLLALHQVKEPVPDGYAAVFLAVQEKWKHSINCWSASPLIAGRVLSNWYPIEEGIQLYGATYDSTEHFWQAVKYHPEVTVANLIELLGVMGRTDWAPLLKHLDGDPKLYLPNAYAVEFLRHNLTRQRLSWFSEELSRHSLRADEFARVSQQRTTTHFRFTAYEEKVLWGDLADIFHLVYIFSTVDDPMRKILARYHFDGIYLWDRKMEFISEEFRSLMLEIWKIKFIEMVRFGEVIRSLPLEIRLSHFLNDGDSPDIPIPVYIGYLNRIREMSLAAAQKNAK